MGSVKFRPTGYW